MRTFADKAVLDSLYPIADVLFRFVPFELLSPVMKRVAIPELGMRVVRLIKVAGPKVTVDHLAPHFAQISAVNFSELIPDAEIVWFEDDGHMLPVEEPEGIVEAMTEFLARRLQPAA